MEIDNSSKSAPLKTRTGGLRCQRALIGTALLAAYWFNWRPLVILVTLWLAQAALRSHRGRPWPQQPRWHSGSAPAVDLGDERSERANRFANLLGCLMLMASLLAFQWQLDRLAWMMVAIIGLLATMAGTVGFCLGTALYVVLTKPRVRQES